MATHVARRRYEKFRQSAGIVLALATLVLALIVAVTNAAEDTQWIKDHTWVRIWSAIILGVLTFIQGAHLLWVRIRRGLTGQRREDDQTTLMSLIVSVHRATGVPVQDLGASIFVVQTDWWARGSYLQRIHKVRLSGPQVSDVDWTLGKGAIGEAWETNRYVYCDWHPISVAHGGAAITPAAWQHIPEETKSGFTRQEFGVIVDKYAEIAAIPICDKNDGHVRGVLVVDRVATPQTPGAARKLNDAAVQVLLTLSAGAVAKTWA